MRPLAIYIHVPFCVKKCAYCDFASYAGCENRVNAYFSALWEEIEAWSTELASCTAVSVFFGGGTPSMVPAKYIAHTLTILRGKISFADDAEISIEANPGTLTEEMLLTYRMAGINRISIGVQSLRDTELRMLGRIHTAEQALETVRMARQSGFENINIDLMYALPEQSMESWRDTLQNALKLPITHISAYSLIIEPNTEMARRVDADEVRLPDEGTVIDMQRICTRMLREAGFARYEISNYAQDGYACRHNLIYWQGGEYLGFGSAAHSLLGNARFRNPDGLDAYLSGVRKTDYSERTAEDQKEERLMLETRTVRGLDLKAWKAAFGEEFPVKKAEILKKNGLIEIENGYLRLTERGLELQDAVVLELLETK